MTKNQFIDLVIHRMAGGDVTPDLKSKYHPEIVSKYATIVINNLLFDTFKKNNEELDLFSEDYEEDVILDTSRNLRYCEMPVSVVQLPWNCGIRLVTYLKDQTTSIKPISASSQPILANLEVNEICTAPVYFITDNRLYFRNIDTSVQKMMIKAIPPFDELDDDDTFHFPSGRGPEIADLIGKFLLSMPPEDLRNDNNSER